MCEKGKRVYSVIADSDGVYRWQWRVPGRVCAHTGRQGFTSMYMAECETRQVASFNAGLYQCPECGTLYDPTHYGNKCPGCATRQAPADWPTPAEVDEMEARHRSQPEAVSWNEGPYLFGTDSDEYGYLR